MEHSTSKTICVKNLYYFTKPKIIIREFSRFGTIKNIKVCRTIAFIEFDKYKQAQLAIKKMNREYFFGQKLYVELAKNFSQQNKEKFSTEEYQEKIKIYLENTQSSIKNEDISLNDSENIDAEANNNLSYDANAEINEEYNNEEYPTEEDSNEEYQFYPIYHSEEENNSETNDQILLENNLSDEIVIVLDSSLESSDSESVAESIIKTSFYTFNNNNSNSMIDFSFGNKLIKY